MLRTRNQALQNVSVWAPVALCISGRLPPVLSGRSIEIRLQRAAPADGVSRFRSGKSAVTDLRRMAERWAVDNAGALQRAEGALERTDDENWAPLLLVAQQAGPEWEHRAHVAMRASRMEAEPSALETLLAGIRSLLAQRAQGQPVLPAPNGKQIADRDRIRSADLARLLAESQGGHWAEWGRTGQPLSAHALAKLLAPAAIRPATLRFRTADQNGPGADIVGKVICTPSSQTPSAATFRRRKPNELRRLQKRRCNFCCNGWESAKTREIPGL